MDSDKLRNDFMLDFASEHTFCNHGSYGAPPRRVFDLRQRLLKQIESDVEKWDRFRLRDRYLAACRRAARFVGADENGVALVRNTTTGINAVVNSLGPKITGIVVFSHVYAAMMNTARVHELKFRSNVTVVDINLPIANPQEVIDAFSKVVKNDPSINFAIIDHISSASAIVFPVAELIAICRTHGVTTCIDGAHAPGQLDLNMGVLKPDFYVGNLHKWCYAMRGTALLYVSPPFINIIQPVATSHNYKQNWQDNFYDQGTDDITNYMLVDEALDYYDAIGGRDALVANADSKLNALRHRLCDQLGCSWYPIPVEMEAPFMKIVKLPDSCRYERSWKGADQLWSDLNEKYKLSVYISFANGSLWLRISINCYNNQSDMDKVFDKVAMMLSDKYEIVYRRSANSTD